MMTPTPPTPENHPTISVRLANIFEGIARGRFAITALVIMFVVAIGAFAAGVL